MNEVITPVGEAAVLAKADEVAAAALTALDNEVRRFLPGQFQLIAVELTRDLRALFGQFNFGTPEVLDGMAACVELAIKDLNGADLHDAKPLFNAVHEWSGEAAFAFRDHFAARLPWVAANQRYALGALYNSVKASQAIMYRGRQGVLDIGDATIAELKKIEPPDPTKLLLLVAGVVGTVAAAWVPLIGTSVVASGAISAAAMTARLAGVEALGLVMFAQAPGVDAVITEAKEVFGVHGEDTAAVLNSMWAALGQLRNAIEREHEVLQANVYGDMAKLTAEYLLPHRGDAAVDAARNHDLDAFRPPPADD